MTSNNQAETISKLAAAAVAPTSLDLNNIEDVMLIPEGYKVDAYEQLRHRPRHIKEHSKFHDINSFCEYIDTYQTDMVAIRAEHDIRETRFEATLDYHVNCVAPAHGFHRATFEPQRTQEWADWLNNDGKRMEQRLFANWNEDNLEYIGEPNGAELLNKIRTFSSSMGVKSNTTLSGHDSEATATARIDIQDFPEFIKLKMSPWRYFEPAVFKARLTVDTTGSSPVFGYQIVRKDLVLEHFFNQCCEKVRAISDANDDNDIILYL